MYTLLPIKGKGSSNWGDAWVPIVGPFLGMAAAVAYDWFGGSGPGLFN
jgi:glycerol uptake facilitator protein